MRFAPLSAFLLLAAGCSAQGNTFSEASGAGGGASASSEASGTGGGSVACDSCSVGVYTPCQADGSPGQPQACAAACTPGLGCTACSPGERVCVGEEVHACADDGSGPGGAVETCDVGAGEACANGQCQNACDLAADQPSNVGCEFWAVDLDQQDALNDPASAPWGVALSNVGDATSQVTIEINTAKVGDPIQTQVVKILNVPANSLQAVTLPTRELDCGTKPNDYASPGTCLSSRAYRITSTTPIVVTQYNTFANSYSNDASLLLPSNALGKIYRVIGWTAGHPVPTFGIIDRSYVTIIGTRADTTVTVKPTYKIKGNAPIAATAAGGIITVKLGAFDVLNLETDDATLQEDLKTATDLSGTLVQSDQPVAVFTGTESAGTPGGVLDVPTYSGWTSDDTCCLDHLEDQLFPVESVGTSYVIARSPVRSTSGFREPDVIRFVGAAEVAQVTTSLPAPFDSFTLQPGEVKTTWAQDNIVVTSDKPVMVGQLLVSGQYVDGPYIGDPSLTVFPPVTQFRSEYVILTTTSWDQSWIVITAEVGGAATIDGASPTNCIVEPAGMVEGKTYESRRCPVTAGVHKLSGDKPFGITAYGYGSAGAYAFIGGADVKHVYDPPPIK